VTCVLDTVCTVVPEALATDRYCALREADAEASNTAPVGTYTISCTVAVTAVTEWPSGNEGPGGGRAGDGGGDGVGSGGDRGVPGLKGGIGGCGDGDGGGARGGESGCPPGGNRGLGGGRLGSGGGGGGGDRSTSTTCASGRLVANRKTAAASPSTTVTPAHPVTVNEMPPFVFLTPTPPSSPYLASVCFLRVRTAASFRSPSVALLLSADQLNL